MFRPPRSPAFPPSLRLPELPRQLCKHILTPASSTRRGAYEATVARPPQGLGGEQIRLRPPPKSRTVIKFTRKHACSSGRCSQSMHHSNIHSVTRSHDTPSSAAGAFPPPRYASRAPRPPHPLRSSDHRAVLSPAAVPPLGGLCHRERPARRRLRARPAPSPRPPLLPSRMQRARTPAAACPATRPSALTRPPRPPSPLKRGAQASHLPAAWP